MSGHDGVRDNLEEEVALLRSELHRMKMSWNKVWRNALMAAIIVACVFVLSHQVPRNAALADPLEADRKQSEILLRDDKSGDVLWRLAAEKVEGQVVLQFQDAKGNNVASLTRNQRDFQDWQRHYPTFSVFSKHTSVSLAIHAESRGMPNPEVVISHGEEASTSLDDRGLFAQSGHRSLSLKTTGKNDEPSLRLIGKEGKELIHLPKD